MRIARTLVALATAGIVTPGAPPAAAATTDHDLVFLVDGAGSIDATDWTIQLQGFAAALQDRVNFPLDGSMSVSVVQWSDRARAEPSTCSVSYQIQGTWPGGYGAHVTIVNTGPVAIDGWKLEWKPADGESVTRGWDADIVTAPSGVTATAMSWNRMVAPGGSVRFGFNGSIVGAGPPVVPSSFLLNGATCL